MPTIIDSDYFAKATGLQLWQPQDWMIPKPAPTAVIEPVETESPMPALAAVVEPVVTESPMPVVEIPQQTEAVLTVDEVEHQAIEIELISDPIDGGILLILSEDEMEEKQSAVAKRFLIHFLSVLFTKEAPIMRAYAKKTHESIASVSEQLQTLHLDCCLVFGDSCNQPIAQNDYAWITLPSLAELTTQPGKKEQLWQVLFPQLQHWRLMHPEWIY